MFLLQLRNMGYSSGDEKVFLPAMGLQEQSKQPWLWYLSEVSHPREVRRRHRNLTKSWAKLFATAERER